MHHDSDLRNVIWQLAFQYKVNIKRAIRQYGLSLNGMHVRLLHMIRATPDCTANQLVASSGRDKAQITRLLKELEAMALITRTPHPGDRRSQIVALSEQGQGLMERTREVENDVEERLLKGVSRKDVDTFVAIAHKMLDNLRDGD